MNSTTREPQRSVALVPRPGELTGYARCLSTCLVLILLAGAASQVRAQTTAHSTGASVPPPEETVLELSPFEVRASSDVGYVATETLGGSRLNTQLKDVATQVNVMTREFMQDLAITSLDDAIRYSLNTETRFESVDINSPSNLGLADSLNVVGGGQGGRSRGLTAPNNSHDFFDTFVRMDSYNTERFTFASGPNSILFGNSSPSGTIDTTFKRAQTTRRFFDVENRLTSTGSRRASIDLNQPILKNRLAVRVAGLVDRDENWRKPAFQNQDRLYTALTFTPFKMMTIRAYNERSRTHQAVAKNTLLQDHVTPWLMAGKPMFDNGAGKSLTLDPSVTNAIRKPNAPVRAIVSYDGNGFTGNPIVPQTNMALGIGYNDLIAAPNNLERSITDPSIYPFDRNINGDASQALFYSTVQGASLELNPFRNFFLEAAFNHEVIRNRAAEIMDGRTHQLQVDPNLYLNDRVTPNPHAGDYYVEDAVGGINSNVAKNYGAKDQRRLSLSYELNFENHKGWTKWLGMHRIAALFDHLESTSVSEISQLTISPFSTAVSGQPYSFVVANNANSAQVGFRYYIDPAKDDWTVRLPFDLLHDGVITQPGWVDANGKQVYLGAFDPSVPPNTPSTARNRVDSRAFVAQSYFLNRRMILGYGWRRDSVDIVQDPAPKANWNFDDLLETINWQVVKHEVPVNTVKSIVLHPFSWVSFAYSETTSKQVRTEVIRSPDGTIVPTGSGLGRDYGVTFRVKDWFSIRFNKYEDSGLGNISSVANGTTPTAAPGANNTGSNFKNTTAALERSIQINAPDYDPANPNVAPASTLSANYAYYQQDLARVTAPSGTIGGEISNRYAVNSDSVANGYELTLTANPTPSWRIAVTGAKNTASESNIGGQWWDFIRERLPIWASAANLAGGSTPSTTLNKAGVPVNVVMVTSASGNPLNYRTYSQVIAAALANYQYIADSEGKLNNNIRKYRFTATTRYSFTRGRLKGLFVGGNYVWRSPAAVGYPISTKTPDFIPVPAGLAVADVNVSDASRPFWGGALTSFDAFAGYNRRIFGGKVGWRVQLNVRNVLNNDDLLVQRTSTDGVGVNFTPQEPRSFILTNTFSF